MGRMSVQSIGVLYGEMGNYFCSNVTLPWAVTTETTALNLENLVRVPSTVASTGREKTVSSDPHSIDP